MCFSPEMDAAAGLTVTVIGIDALRHAERREQVALAALPVLFGVHQLVETFVWLQLRGHVGSAVGDLAAWIYLAIALVIVPVAVPYAFLRVGSGRWPWLDRLFVLGGVIVAFVYAAALGLDPGERAIEGHQISYFIGFPNPPITLTLYVIVACGPALVARSKILQAFGLGNLVAVVALAALNQNGVVSLWCVWAAITSVLINLYLRGVRLPLKDSTLNAAGR